MTSKEIFEHCKKHKDKEFIVVDKQPISDYANYAKVVYKNGKLYHIWGYKIMRLVKASKLFIIDREGREAWDLGSIQPKFRILSEEEITMALL